MAESTSVRRRLILALAAIALIAVAGVLAILPYRLYSRDIQQATTDAHRLSSVVHAAISHTLIERTGDAVALTDLVNRFQGLAGIEIRLRPLGEGELHPAATSDRGTSTRSDTDLTYVAPPIRDADGRTWLASMYFDLTPMKQKSIRLITDLVLAVVLGSVGFSLVIFFLIRGSLLKPIESVTLEIRRIADGTAPDEEIRMPDFDTSEMARLARVVEDACRARGSHG